ncbi:efflux RND transporter permease subunit [bacterium]|nr:efflux RND transporter permease subunit [bacterium]
MRPLWIFFLERKSFTYLLMISLVAAGLLSTYLIPKESAPEVIVPVGVVSTTLRGSSAEDVEKLVTNKLEQEIANVENIDKITSSSMDGMSVISAQFFASANVDKSIQDLKDAIDKVQSELPEEADKPVVSKVNFADQPSLIVSISKDLTPRELTQLSDDLKRELKKVKGVSKVEVSGIRKREVQVVVQKEKLLQYGISLNQVVGALQSANTSLPIGKITVGPVDYPIKFSGSIEEGSEVSDVSFATDSGTVVYVRDIARVSDGLENPTTYSRVSVAGEPSQNSFTLFVFKKSGGDVTEISNRVKTRIDELKSSLLRDAQVAVSIDNGKQVRKDLSELVQAGIETVILVMLVLFLTIGWRESLVAGLSIPLSFVIAFIGLYYSGNTINFVSLFSLILAIGILVDAGIVVAEAIHTRLNKLGNVHDAAVQSINEYAWPLIAGTMTTVAVFFPLFFLSGITGKFIQSIPFTIIFVLVASIVVALGMVPVLATILTRKEAKYNRFTELQEEYFHKVQTWYKSFLSVMLESRALQRNLFIGLALSFIGSIMLLVGGFIKVELFPQDNQNFVVVSIEKPEGTPLAYTDLVTRQVEEVLYAQPYVESFVTTVGESSGLLDNSAGGKNTKYANITVILKEDRGSLTSTDVVGKLRGELSGIKGGVIKVGQGNNGPPSGKPVLIQFKGDDLEQLALIADKAEKILQEIKGAAEVETSLRDDGTQFELVIDRAKAAQAGISTAAVAQTLRTAVSGAVATRIKKQDDDIDILVRVGLNPSSSRLEEVTKTTLDSISNLQIPSSRGPVLLGTLLDTKVSESRSVIKHDKQKRVVSVSSELKDGATATEVVNVFSKREKELDAPSSVQIVYGGETEEIDNTFRDMLLALIAGMVLMLAILVLEFNSFRYSFYLLGTIPLSLIGVLVGLFVMGKAFSFSAMLGLVALAGVIINHAIILLDSMIHRLDAEKEKGNKNVLFSVIVESAAIRLRPIVLTTVTTVVGMIPLAGVSALWGPLAIAIMFGLAFAMILTLVLIPVLFYRYPGARYRDLK